MYMPQYFNIASVCLLDIHSGDSGITETVPFSFQNLRNCRNISTTSELSSETLQSNSRNTAYNKYFISHNYMNNMYWYVYIEYLAYFTQWTPM